MNTENLNKNVQTQAENKNNGSKNQLTQIYDLLTVKSDEFKNALPKGLEGIDLERFIRACKTVVNKNPELVQCDRSSLMNALLDCAFYGFLPNSNKGYLIPYKQQVSFQLGYKGCLELLYRTNQIAVLDCMEVYKEEMSNFKCQYGTNKIFQHIPALDKEDRGDIVLFYVYAKFKNGQEKFVTMSKKEIEEVKNSAKSGKVWNTHYVQMALKTVLIKFFKFCDLTPVMQRVIEDDSKNNLESGSESNQKYNDAIDTTSAIPRAEVV